MTPDEDKNRRQRNRVLAGILVGFVVLTFLVTIVKLQAFG